MGIEREGKVTCIFLFNFSSDYFYENNKKEKNMFIACVSLLLHVALVTMVSVAWLPDDGPVAEAANDEVQDWCRKKTQQQH